MRSIAAILVRPPRSATPEYLPQRLHLDNIQCRPGQSWLCSATSLYDFAQAGHKHAMSERPMVVVTSTDGSNPGLTAGPPAAQAGGILTVDLSAIEANWRALGRRAMPAECAAVVKADGYGLRPRAGRQAARPRRLQELLRR